MSSTVDYSNQIDVVLRLLDGKQLSRDSPVFKKALEWIGVYKGDVDESRRQKLLRAVQSAFAISEPEIYAAISGVPLPKEIVSPQGEAALETLLPKGGWMEWYVDYTRKTESPLAFHVFSSLCVLGASLGRRVYKRMGFYNIYPNYNVVLIGPTGRVKKTSAVNIAQQLIKSAALCPIMADKPTPEALTRALKTSGHHFIYAPEFSVFFSKQKYMEGMTITIIRLLDCPDEYKIATLARGEETVTNVALTILGGSTLSLLASATPTEVTSSGFLNRFIPVVENDSERIWPVPYKGPNEERLLATLARLKAYAGEMEFEPTAVDWYNEWYHAQKLYVRAMTDEVNAEMIERLPDHMLRTAMLLHLSQHDDFWICRDCLERASSLMRYIQARLPQTATAINQNLAAQDNNYLLNTLRRLGGACDHSKLMRRVSSRLDKTRLHRCIENLSEQHLVREERRGAVRYYILTSTGEIDADTT